MPKLLSALLIVLLSVVSAGAQERPVITPQNAAQVHAVLYTGEGNAESLDISPDGTLLAVGTGIGAYVHHVDDLAHPSPLTNLGAGVGVSDVEFSPDSTMLATAWSDGTVEVFAPLTGESLGGWKSFNADTAATALAFSTDGLTLAVGSADGEVVSYSLADGTQNGTYTGLTGVINWLGFDPNAPRLIGITRGFNGLIVAWDTADASVLYTLSHGSFFNTQASFSPDGKALALPPDTYNILNIDPATGTTGLSLLSRGGGTTDIEYLPDGRIVSAGVDFNIYIDDIDLTDPVNYSYVLDGHDSFIDDMAVSPDGATFYSVGDDGQLIVWDIATAKFREKYQLYTGDNHVIAPMNDSRHVAIGGADGMLRIWDVETDTFTLTNTSLNPDVLQSAIYGIDFTPDESKIAVANAQGFVQLFSYPDFESLESMAIFSPISMEISPDGTMIAGGGNDETLNLLPVDGSQEFPTEQDPIEGKFSVVHWTPNGVTIAAGGGTYQKYAIWLYDIDKTTPYFTLNVPDEIYEFAYSPTKPNGDLIALSFGPYDNPTIALFDFATGDQISLEGHPSPVYALAFSPDGAIVATGCADGKVRLFDAVSGALLAELPFVKGPIRDVAFSPDGTRLFSTSDDGSTSLWIVQ